VAARGKNRQFTTAYKLKAIKRVERGEGVLPVARELGISRKILHDWNYGDGAFILLHTVPICP
jgi:transposase